MSIEARPDAGLEPPSSDSGAVAPADAEGPPRRSRAAGLFSNLAPPLVVFVAFIAFWYAVSYLFLEETQRFLLPPPHDVVIVSFLDTVNLTEILDGLFSTAQVALVGLFIAIVIGVCFAVLMSLGKWVERSLYPYAVILQTVPILAIVPLIGFWFDFNFRSRVIVCVIIALFPIITNTLFGLQSVDQQMHDLFTLHKASRWTRLLKLQLPHALPAIFAGFRISAGLSVIGAIVGDFFFRQGEPGIGRLLDVYRAALQSEQLFAALFFSSLLGLVVFWFFGLVGHLLTRHWHDTAGRQV